MASRARDRLTYQLFASEPSGRHDDLVDRTALACVGGDADALIDARTIPPHSPAVIQDELGIGDLPHHSNIIILEHAFSFPESPRDSNLISYADLHYRGNQHVPLSLSGRFELAGLPIALDGHCLAIRFPDGPLLARPEPSRRTRMESDHSAGRIV